jgi:alpha-amylase/alpha-mannosidase (GH57 family)
MADVALALLWHHHQPYYPDDVAGQNPMPWVRLHGVKDYYGMALHLLEFPEMRCTINLVPSLLSQLEGYTERGATDRFLEISRRPADGLGEADGLFVLDHFFMANVERMIRPYPRFAELLERRDRGGRTAADALSRFRARDLRDLQVWFNLTWIHPLVLERDADLRALVAKGKDFSEDDKRYVLDKHLEILRSVIPLHRRLAAAGQVELTTTPYYHPILPLLLDKNLAREALPHVTLPRYTGGYPEDADRHVRRAVEEHTRVFQQAPAGMWPAEGSVCQSMLPLLARHGIRWLATDEDVLSRSTHGAVGRDVRGHVNHPERLYRPYRVSEGRDRLAIVFRDHALSDLVGFQYQRSDPVGAADDFVAKLGAIGQAVTGNAPALVSVILDGENCWEHYPGGGVPFLRALYERCTRSRSIRPRKIGEFLEEHPPRESLSRLSAGSWISNNFAIWIGHAEDNAGWDALHETREYLLEKTRNGQGEQGTGPVARELSPQLSRAWEELYIAQGSDWFWWYGEDHSCAQDELFDYLFRKHLQNVYTLLGAAPPPELGRPIKRRSRPPLHTAPHALLDVRVDGKRTYFEWVGAGRYRCGNERGTMAMSAPGPLREVFFGFDLRDLFVRIDFEGPAGAVMSRGAALRLVLEEPDGWELEINAPGPGEQTVRLRCRGEEVSSDGVRAAVGPIAEIALPFDALGIPVGRSIRFFVELRHQGHSRDRAPREGTITVTRPSPDFERLMWHV